MKVKVTSLSCVLLFSTPWTVAYQDPLSMGFSRQEYWCGLPLPSPGDLPDPGIEPGSLTLGEDSLPSEPPGKPSCPTYVHFSTNYTAFSLLVHRALSSHGEHQGRTYLSYIFVCPVLTHSRSSVYLHWINDKWINDSTGLWEENAGRQVQICWKSTCHVFPSTKGQF